MTDRKATAKAKAKANAGVRSVAQDYSGAWKADPFGNDRQKGNGNSKSKGKFGGLCTPASKLAGDPGLSAAASRSEAFGRDDSVRVVRAWGRLHL
jgi:hypothetical protein